MKNIEVLFLCGAFTINHEMEIINKSKRQVEQAANAFQIKLIDGLLLKENVNLSIISAPFIGPYPKSYKDIYFKGFETNSNLNEFEYVHFNNIWGLRNFSRTIALRKAIVKFAKLESNSKCIIIYSPHTPLLEAAVKAKEIDDRIKICLIVPDLPQFMNLSSGSRLLYDLLKKIDIMRFRNLSRKIDSFVILTKEMKSQLRIGERKYLVIEGVAGDSSYNSIYMKKKNSNNTIVYTGKLNEIFGVLNLVLAFELIQDINLRLVICGNGELEKTLRDYSKIDSRINFLGQIPITEAKRIIRDATILVNPRQNNELYTKYSFPSKIIDYLSSGNPVIAYKLDGVPEIYDNFLNYVEDNSINSLKNKIEAILNSLNSEEILSKSAAAIEYFRIERRPEQVVAKIIDMIETC